MKLILDNPLVSPEYLMKHLNASNLVILNATMKKITGSNKEILEEKRIKNARFFDIKYVFSDQKSALPNTMLTENDFEKKAQALGINKDSAIVVYDDLGIYSAPRVWWMFKSMGHTNIAVLDGGLPAWKRFNFPTESPFNIEIEKGNFKASYNESMFCDADKVLKVIDDKSTGIFDARSKGRFDATEKEPRHDLRNGHIPSSVNIPFSTLQKDGIMLKKEELKPIFEKLTKDKEEVIFSCGSGITACILALAADISEVRNLVVYDGSWTDWGGNHNLPIEK